jgi:hypothetical protein
MSNAYDFIPGIPVQDDMPVGPVSGMIVDLKSGTSEKGFFWMSMTTVRRVRGFKDPNKLFEYKTTWLSNGDEAKALLRDPVVKPGNMVTVVGSLSGKYDKERKVTEQIFRPITVKAYSA